MAIAATIEVIAPKFNGLLCEGRIDRYYFHSSGSILTRILSNCNGPLVRQLAIQSGTPHVRIAPDRDMMSVTVGATLASVVPWPS